MRLSFEVSLHSSDVAAQISSPGKEAVTSAVTLWAQIAEEARSLSNNTALAP